MSIIIENEGAESLLLDQLLTLELCSNEVGMGQNYMFQSLLFASANPILILVIINNFLPLVHYNNKT